MLVNKGTSSHSLTSGTPIVLQTTNVHPERTQKPNFHSFGKKLSLFFFVCLALLLPTFLDS
jgi:hypothetical protein